MSVDNKKVKQGLLALEKYNLTDEMLVIMYETIKAKTVPTKILADILGLSDRRIRQLTDEKIIKREISGRYNFAESVQAYINFKDESARAPRGDYGEERTRLTKMQADKAAIEIEILRGRYLPFELCKTYWQAILGAVRSKLLSIAGSLKVDYPELENEKIVSIEKKIKQAMVDISETGIPANLHKRLAEYFENNAAALADDGERVG